MPNPSRREEGRWLNKRFPEKEQPAEDKTVVPKRARRWPCTNCRFTVYDDGDISSSLQVIETRRVSRRHCAVCCIELKKWALSWPWEWKRLTNLTNLAGLLLSYFFITNYKFHDLFGMVLNAQGIFPMKEAPEERKSVSKRERKSDRFGRLCKKRRLIFKENRSRDIKEKRKKRAFRGQGNNWKNDGRVARNTTGSRGESNLHAYAKLLSKFTCSSLKWLECLRLSIGTP